MQIPNQTQADKIRQRLELAQGGWVNGREFIQQMMISQAHARIKELQAKGYEIEASDFTDEYKFKSYRLVGFNKRLPI
jgi:biotin operon repressor